MSPVIISLSIQKDGDFNFESIDDGLKAVINATNMSHHVNRTVSQDSEKEMLSFKRRISKTAKGKKKIKNYFFFKSIKTRIKLI
jgi:hypothetical protein